MDWTKLYSFCGIFVFHCFVLVTPATCYLCLIIFQIRCHSCVKRVPHWLPIILIILSNDVHLNPGPQFQNNFFNFMSWNVNSLAKKNFQRVRLIEAHNSIFNYDLSSICETSLNDTVELPETLLNGYTFVPVRGIFGPGIFGPGIFGPGIFGTGIFGHCLLNFEISCQILKIYILISKLKILLQYF